MSAETATHRPKPAARNADIAAIQIARKALGMTREDGQALQLGLVGKASSADMTAAQRAKVLAHLSGLQARAAGQSPKDFRAARKALVRSTDDALDARWRKARALWAELAAAGAVRSNTDEALSVYVQRQTQVSAWRFLNGYQINTVLESLKAWLARTQPGAQP